MAGYVSVRVSAENAEELLEAIYSARDLNNAEGATTGSPEADIAEGLRRAVIDWLLENRRGAMAAANALGRGAQAEALRRDGWRCKKCSRSKIGEGGVSAVRVVGSDMADPGRAAERREMFPRGGDAVENLITLCRECAGQWASLAPARRVAAVPSLLRAIGPAIEREEHDRWIERVVSVLIQPLPCPNGSLQTNGLPATKPSTPATAPTPPR